MVYTTYSLITAHTYEQRGERRGTSPSLPLAHVWYGGWHIHYTLTCTHTSQWEQWEREWMIYTTYSLFTAHTYAIRAPLHDVVVFSSPREDPDICRRLKAEEVRLASSVELFTVLQWSCESCTKQLQRTLC